jgi:curved DNA-binding protein
VSDYKDYYQILGVTREATAAEIKTAYRKLARKYHPDVSQEASSEEKFKEIGEAYEVLKDTEKRAAYDQLGTHWQQGQEFRPPPDWDAGFEYSGGPGSGDSSYSDFFESIFGRGFTAADLHEQGNRKSSKGQDHHARILIALEDSFQGATRELDLQVPELDSTGRVVTRKRTLSLKIPRGVYEGQNIRLAGQGMQGPETAQNGDLYLQIAFKPHDFFHIDGRNIYLELPVTPWEAALGSKLKVPTPTGPVNLNIPAGSQSKRRLRLKGRGIPSKPAGDLYVTLDIVLPDASTESAREIYRNMEKQLGFNPRAKLGV